MKNTEVGRFQHDAIERAAAKRRRKLKAWMDRQDQDKVRQELEAQNVRFTNGIPLTFPESSDRIEPNESLVQVLQ